MKKHCLSAKMNQLAVIAMLISLFLLVGCPCHHGGEGEGEGEGEVENDTFLFSPQDIILPSGQVAQVINECCPRDDVSIVAGDKVHLLYCTTAYTLGYAEKSGDSWRAKTDWTHSGPSDYYGSDNSLALDKNGNIHIACSESDINDENLRYFNNVSGLFATSQPASSLSVGLECKIAVDKNGKVHIAHQRWNDGMVLYTSNVSGSWQTSGIAKGEPKAILIDSQDVIYILYFSVGLQCASNAGAGWQTEEPVADSALTDTVAAAIDQNDTLYVVTGDGLLIRPKGGSWESQDLFGQLFDANPPEYINFRQNSLAVEANGDLHLALTVFEYIGGKANHTFYYATNSSGQWQKQEIDKLIDIDAFQSWSVLALNSAGVVYFAYARNGELVFLTLD